MKLESTEYLVNMMGHSFVVFGYVLSSYASRAMVAGGMALHAMTSNLLAHAMILALRGGIGSRITIDPKNV